MMYGTGELDEAWCTNRTSRGQKRKKVGLGLHTGRLALALVAYALSLHTHALARLHSTVRHCQHCH